MILCLILSIMGRGLLIRKCAENQKYLRHHFTSKMHYLKKVTPQRLMSSHKPFCVNTLMYVLRDLVLVFIVRNVLLFDSFILKEALCITVCRECVKQFIVWAILIFFQFSFTRKKHGNIL